MRKFNRIPSSFSILTLIVIIVLPFLLSVPLTQATSYQIGYTSTGGTYATIGADAIYGQILPLPATDLDGFILTQAVGIILGSSSTGKYAKLCIWAYADGELIATSSERLLSSTNSTAQFYFPSTVYLNESESYRFGVVFSSTGNKLYQAAGAPSTYASIEAGRTMDYDAPTDIAFGADGTVDWCIYVIVADYETTYPTPSAKGNYYWDGAQWIPFNDTENITHQVVQWLPFLLLVAICCGIGVYGAGAWGFFAGLNVAIIIAYVFALVSLWAVVLIIVVDAIALFGKAGMFGRSGKD